MRKQSWNEICGDQQYVGRWIALDRCRYDEVTGNAAEGVVVDVDEDLAELCQRLGESQLRNCAVVQCKPRF